ncbi:MAG: AI-2E family transporter [Campylobacteraceae bacterium]|nr:AI-2E family transporter [Campylobacteraceae bacterium]
MNREPLFLTTLLIVALSATLFLFKAYIGSIVVAAVLAMASFNFYKIMQKYLKSDWLSALAMGFLAIAFIFVPLGYLAFKSIAFVSNMDVGSIQSRIKEVAELGQAILEKVPGVKEQAQGWISSLDFAGISKIIFSYVGIITSKSANFLIDSVFILLFYLCFLVYGKNIANFVFETLPLSLKNREILIKETLMSVRSLFYALFITAFLQGAIFAILILFYGMDALFWGLLYGIASMVPLVGGALVWIPLSIYAWLNISSSAAIVIALYSILILGTLIDNFARPIVVGWVNRHLLDRHKGMHELLVFFAMIAGIGAVGFFGIILGPTIVALTLALMSLMRQYRLESKGV